MYVPKTKMPVICHMSKLPDMHDWGNMPIYMLHMNSLASTIRPGVLYTDNIDADDNTTGLLL